MDKTNTLNELKELVLKMDIPIIIIKQLQRKESHTDRLFKMQNWKRTTVICIDYPDVIKY